LTRPAPLFSAGHFPGSLNIELGSALFSTWTGFLIPSGTPIALVVASADKAAKARLELARIGFDNVLGYTEADSQGNAAAFPIECVTSKTRSSAAMHHKCSMCAPQRMGFRTH
jgi:rhodanese-related sulfurtransferase